MICNENIKCLFCWEENMENWVIQPKILIAAVFVTVLFWSITILVVETNKVEVAVKITCIVVVILFFCYMVFKTVKTEQYCIYFPETGICKAKAKSFVRG